MTIFERPDEQVFASNARPGEVETFPNIERGWGVVFEQTEGKPPMEWFNAIFKRQDEAIRYLMQRGLPEWSATEEYPKGAFVQFKHLVYKAIIDNTNKEPIQNKDIWSEWGLEPNEVLLTKNNLKEIQESGEEAQKEARANIGAISKEEIPKVDITGFVPITRKINGLALDEDIGLTPQIIAAAPAAHTHHMRDIDGLTKQLEGIENLLKYEALLEPEGYITFPNGFTLQWGINYDQPNVNEVTFHKPFNRECFVVMLTIASPQSSKSDANIRAYNYTVGKFNIFSAANEKPVSWLAVGF
ncbi:gp53-like domain-containing protein [Thorsellia anophelis]|uniref:Carbohydrate binding domain-containing protein n=1 Tax=Thorsellia anophelis DSM 18579 TaxID=1123402 RepID=A0A1I0CDK5_9GAMM|nr:hypothetical protein [Thorsellia anophelis]SET17509.1 Carbohydrate binding domain-containing protein [Thorsellia anophelis DSM 18579]